MMYEYSAKIVNVVDGDTVDAVVDLGFNCSIKERFRLFGIDAPEVRTKDLEEKERGIASKIFVEEMCLDKQVTIRSKKDRKGKFGRYLAEILLTDYVLSLNQLMLKEGYADPYR